MPGMRRREFVSLFSGGRPIITLWAVWLQLGRLPHQPRS